ncbi:MAG: AsmA-like C-terminal region-containing protein [Luteibaculum sp.]
MKKVLVALLILLILLGASVVALPIIFKDKLVTLVTNEANKNLNAVLTVKDFKVSIFKDFPNISVALMGYDISGVGQFENVSLVNGEELAISLNLFSLLSGDGYEVEGIYLEKPNVYVYVDKEGNANYDIAKPSEEVEEESPSTEEEGDIQIKLKAWEINEGNLTYDDHSLEVYTALKSFNHSGSGDFSLTQFVMSTQTDAKEFDLGYAGMNYLSQTKLNLSADLDIDLDRMFFGFKQNKLVLNDLELGFNGNVEMPGDDIKMDLALNSSQSSFKNLISLIPAVFLEGYESVQADGEFALDASAKGIYNDNTYPGFDLNLMVKNASVKYPDLPAAITQIALKSRVSSAGGNDLDNVIIDISNFHADIANNPMDLSLYVTTPLSDPNIDAKLYAKLNLENLAKAVPMQGYNYRGKVDANVVMKGKMSSLEMEQYDQFNASGNLSLRGLALEGDSVPMPVKVDSTYLEFNPQYLALTYLQASVEGAALSASGKLSNYMGYIFKDQDLTGNLDLYSDYINLNAFMTEEEGPVTTEPEAETEEEMGYVPVPGNIDFTLNAKVKEMLYEDMVMQDFGGILEVKNKTISFKNVGLKALGGEMVLNGTYATPADEPEVAMDFVVNNLDINTTANTFNTVAKLAPIAKACKGAFNAKFGIRGRLDAGMNPKWESFNGEGLVSTLNVVFEDFEPINRLANKLKMDGMKKQSVQDTKVNFELKEGKVFIKPVETKLGDIPAKIAGYTAIDQSIDYTFNLKVPREKLGAQASDAIAGLSEKLGASSGALAKVIDVDVFITNTVSDPKIRANLAGMANDLKNELVDKAKEELNKKKQELEDEAKKRLEEEKQKALQEAEEAKRKLEEEKQKALDKAEAEKKRLEEEAKRKAEEEKKRLEEEAKKKAKNLFKKP